MAFPFLIVEKIGPLEKNILRALSQYLGGKHSSFITHS
jgi:hypothetical protein